MDYITSLVKQQLKKSIDYRRQLHMHPELGGQEINTSKFIVKELEKMDIEVKTGFAKTGVQGMIYGNNPSGKTIMIRADIDALPIKEMNDIEYKSKYEGIMHACGHDVHTAILLGTANILSKIRHKLNGNVKLCFQPAEESTGGADLMISDGIMDNPKVDYVIGLHVDPTNEVGTVAIEEGAITSYPDFFDIRFIGKGGHGSFPSKAKDPILPAIEAYSMISSITKNISPLDPCVVQICKFNAGTVNAAIPDISELGGTVRTLSSENREIIKNKIEKIVKNISDVHDITYEYKYRGKSYPVYNNKDFVAKVKKSVASVFDKGFVINETMKMGGEDFCFYCDYAPATFMIVGSSNENISTQYGLHNPNFNVDEGVIEKGIEAFVRISIDFLSK